MPQGRPAIPRELERALLIEAGYRCAIPTCRAVRPLEIDHIEDYAKVKEHKFENMIVLCGNCHGMKGEGPRELNRAALRQFKANLSLLNHRYGDLERRLLDEFARHPEERIKFLPGSMDLLVKYLVEDGFLVREAVQGGETRLTGTDEHEGLSVTIPKMVFYSLTAAGEEFVQNWIAALPLD